MTTAVVLPTYNEREVTLGVVREILGAVPISCELVKGQARPGRRGMLLARALPPVGRDPDRGRDLVREAREEAL